MELLSLWLCLEVRILPEDGDGMVVIALKRVCRDRRVHKSTCRCSPEKEGGRGDKNKPSLCPKCRNSACSQLSCLVFRIQSSMRRLRALVFSSSVALINTSGD